MDENQLSDKIKDPLTREDGFHILVNTYQERLYWHIRKMVIDHDDADDLLQEVFIKIWKNLDKFRQESSLYTWLYRIATNECLNFLNRQKRRSILSLKDASTELNRKLGESVYVSGSEIQMKLQKALLTLPDKQRLVFNMKYFDDMTYERIAEITGTSVGSLKASYHIAVKKIENYLKID